MNTANHPNPLLRPRHNPYLAALQPYPFEKLRQLFAGVIPNPNLRAINLSIGEPKHATPNFIKDALSANLHGLAQYPTTLGEPVLRETIARWAMQRYQLPALDAATQILPVNGSREALFAFAQTVLDPRDSQALVLCPNPFYQIYEGAALLGGAQPYFVNCTSAQRLLCDYQSVPDDIWARTRLVFACSPGNPTGAVMSLEDWRFLFAKSDQYGFVIASDECYSEIYFGDNNAKPPLGGLQAAQLLGRSEFRNLVMFSSLSKRSNVPGLRSGFVAGEAQLIKAFLLYRTYHGSAMNPAVQQASIAAWADEQHVQENRRLYTQKFSEVVPVLQQRYQANLPDAAFYVWLPTPISDTEFARRLLEQYNVTVLPGSYLARSAHGCNPGENHVRIALVASPTECLEAAQRLHEFAGAL